MIKEKQKAKSKKIDFFVKNREESLRQSPSTKEAKKGTLKKVIEVDIKKSEKLLLRRDLDNLVNCRYLNHA